MAPQIMRCVLKGHLFGTVQTRNIFTADVNILGAETISNIWAGYLDDIVNPLKPYLATIWTTDAFEIQLQEGSLWSFLEEYPFLNVGTGSGNSLPNAVAGVFIGHVAGNKAMGRKFWSGLAESAVSGNSLVSGALAAFATAAAAYVTTFTGVDDSYIAPGLVVKSGVFRPFISGFVASLLGSMRRRKPGLGI